MTISYLDRTAVLQSLTVVFLRSVATLLADASPPVGTFGGSAFGPAVVSGGLNVDGAAPTNNYGGLAAYITAVQNYFTQLPVDPPSPGSTQQIFQYGMLGTQIIFTPIVYSGANYALFAATVPPSTGTALVTRFTNSDADFGSPQLPLIAPMPVVFNGMIVMSYAISDEIAGTTTGTSLTFNGASFTTRAIWEGTDTTINDAGANIPEGIWPDLAHLKNYLTISGFFSGNLPKPLLIDAAQGGAENGRFYIGLDDPTWNAVFTNWAGVRGLAMLLPNNFGWFAPLNIDVVHPPTFILLNPDMTKYWIYVLQGADQAAINAIVNSNWGKGGTERIFMSAPSSGVPGDILITGAGDTAESMALILSNASAGPSRLLTVPMPTPLPCVPCAPLVIEGNGWQGRLA